MSLAQREINITLTEAACAHVQTFLKPLGTEAGFRVAVKASGCSGFSDVLDVAEKPQKDDFCFLQHGVQIFVAADSITKLQGSVIDLLDKGAGQKQLIFKNPNVVDSCGCGESFVIKDEI
jgi:iron-sulfur cluster assembly protein